jgi:LemA protein
VSVLATIAIVLIVVFVAGAVYDRLVKLRRHVQHTWKQLEEQRHQRQEIVGRVADACAGSAVDAAAVEAVVVARQHASRSSGPADAAQKDHALGDAVGQLLTSSAIAIDAKMGRLARELGEVERTYREARQAYNDGARRYNAAIASAPGRLVASFGSFRRAELYERPSP